MARITKNTEERRQELIDTAEELFMTKGYSETIVSDIVKKINVAQGTFYYYFKSKEDIFLAIFDNYIKNHAEKLQSIEKNNSINEIEKINKILEMEFEVSEKDMPLIKYLHESENAGLHQRVMINSVKKYSSIISKIIKEGVDNKIFKTNYPLQVSEFFWLNLKFICDPGISELSNEEYQNKINSLIEIMNKILEVPNGTIKFIMRN